MLTDLEKKYVIRIAKQQYVIASGAFSSGYGGLWRPIPIPEPYNRLVELKLCTLEIQSLDKPIKASDGRMLTGQWIYKITDQGAVMAKMLE